MNRLLLLLLFSPFAAAAQSVDPGAIDAVFSEYVGTDRPGCTLGVGLGDDIIVERAWGMADLEHDVINTPSTILEPGSVSKQFTAAAVILLALDGSLSLDDDVRTHIPELPDYGDTITVRHLIHHTSGLRDWGAVAAIGGWPRTSRAHTHMHALDIIARQTALNYRPGEYYSYTNTGYTLQVILVERVSGMSFQEFSRDRIFQPLGMTRTEWRDDFTRVVRDRAVAYRPAGNGEYRMLMPFEDVHGNGGLLTTVGDLLRFTRSLDTASLGGPRFVEEMHRQGVLNNGRVISYAGGLVEGARRGIRMVSHSGATAGYRGYLARFPDRGLSVAVMCNTASANAGRLALEVADLFLGDSEAALERAEVRPELRLSPERLEALAGPFVVARNGSLLQIESVPDGLRVRGDVLVSITGTRFTDGSSTLEFLDEGHAYLADADQDTLRLTRTEAYAPTPEDLEEFAGEYHSAEAEVTFWVSVEDGALIVRDRYGQGGAPPPLYPDTFGRSGIRSWRFLRDSRDRVTGFSLYDSRVWDLRFERVE